MYFRKNARIFDGILMLWCITHVHICNSNLLYFLISAKGFWIIFLTHSYPLFLFILYPFFFFLFIYTIYM